MTKDEIFDKIDEVYSDHDGGAIYLSDERTEHLKNIIQQAINFIPCCTGEAEQLVCDKCETELIHHIGVFRVCDNCGNRWVAK